MGNSNPLEEDLPVAVIPHGEGDGYACPLPGHPTPDPGASLYHGSPTSGLRVLEPCSLHQELRPDGTPVLFATPWRAVASCFLFRWHDDLARLGTWDRGETWVFRVAQPDAIEFTGGSIYRVEREGFVHNPDAGLGPHEWMTTTPVRVLEEERWACGLDAMGHHGVMVRWPADQARAADLLKMRLEAEGLSVSPWRAFVDGIHSEFDLLVLRAQALPAAGLVYSLDDLVAILEVEGIAPFARRGPERVKARFDAVRALRGGLFCAYVLVAEEGMHYWKPTREFLGYPVYDLPRSGQRDPLLPVDEWRGLWGDLMAIDGGGR